MARADVFVSVDNGNRQVNIGGGYGRQTSQADVTVNTDNATHDDCPVKVSCRVKGDRNLGGKPRKTCHDCRHNFGDSNPVAGETCPKCGAVRQGQDTRVSVFELDVPEQDDEYCLVYINGIAFSKLVFLGDDDIVEQVKRRGLYDRIVVELFGKNPLIDDVPSDTQELATV